MGRSRLLASMLTGAAALVAGTALMPVNAHAAPAPVPTTVTLPLFGAQLTVEITTGPGGNLATVAVNPADGLILVKDRPNKVAFVNEDGTAKLVVGGHDGAQKVQARAGSLADVTGPGSWSGDVFGTGTATTVNFVVGESTETPGAPDITGVTTDDATAEIGDTVLKSGDEGSSASVKIKFVSGDQSRFLTIRVRVETESEGDDDSSDSNARISISLSKLVGVPQPADSAAGTKTWSGPLCNGDPATITYTVNADGSLTDVSATPDTATIRGEGNKVTVRFSEKERVNIRIRLKDGSIAVQVDQKFRCGVTPEVTGASTTTIDPSTSVEDDSKQDDHRNGDDSKPSGRGGDHGGEDGSGKGGGGKGGDDGASHG